MDRDLVRNQRLSLGVVLSICGISIGGLIKLAIGINYSWISSIIVVATVYLLFDIRHLSALRHLPKGIFSIYLYSLYTICLAIFCGAPFSGSTISVVYQIVYFIQIVLIFSLSKNYDSNEFLRIAFWIMGVSAIVTIILINIKGFSVGYGVLLSRTDEANAVSRATTGFIAYYGICVALTYKPRNSLESIAKIVFFLVSLVVLIMSSRRSSLLAFIIILVLYYRNRRGEIKFDRHKLIRIMLFVFVIIGIAIVIFRMNETLQSAFERAWNSLLNGFQTYLGKESTDMSAGYRRARIESIPDEYFNHSSFSQFVFGRGYNTDWLDIPYLQAFWDLGLIGGIWFLYIQGIAPFCHVIKKPNNSVIEFAQYYVILQLIQNFANGTPYGNFLPIVLLYTLERAYDFESNSNIS